jgi:DNA-binding IclR family transcriptional regulator
VVGEPASNVMAKHQRETATDPRMATTLERGLRILDAFRAGDDGPLGNSEIAKRARLPKATVSRLTYTLTKLGYLLHDARRGYSLGPGVLGPAYVFYSRLDIRQVARPHLRRLATRPGVYLSLGVRHELRIISLESVTADWPAPLTGLFNAQAPIAQTAAGHAYLASLPLNEREEMMQALEGRHQKGDWKVVRAHIERDIAAVNAHGYCTVRGEWHPTLNAVGVPLLLSARHLTLVLSAGGPSQLLGEAELDELGVALRDVARQIEREAGGSSMSPL